MKKLTKYLAVLLGIAALLAFSACDSGSTESGVSSSLSSQESSLSSHVEASEESSETHSAADEEEPDEAVSDTQESSTSSHTEAAEESFAAHSTNDELLKGAEEAAQEWVDELLTGEGEHELLECFYQNIDIYQISEDQNTICFSVEMVFKPKVYDEPFWWAGNTQEGTGELEGYLLWGREVKAEKGSDGWTRTNVGTGGVRLDS